jgi:ankyrin repeat protein
VNAKDVLGQTVLMIASEKGHKKVVKILLENGANVNAKNYFGQTVLMIASEKGHKKVV